MTSQRRKVQVMNHAWKISYDGIDATLDSYSVLYWPYRCGTLAISLMNLGYLVLILSVISTAPFWSAVEQRLLLDFSARPCIISATKLAITSFIPSNGCGIQTWLV